MAYLTKKQISITRDKQFFILDLKVNVTTDGDFTASIDKKYLNAIKGVFQNSYKINKETITIIAPSLDKLMSSSERMLDIHNTPKITKENIIAYNIESHVSFCENDKGDIFPNGTYQKDLQWAINDKYGEHHASSPAKDGYSLTVGAVAYTKITKDYNGNKVVVYNAYYGENGSHLGNKNPAEKLNSWCSFSLYPENCRQMPYSDESAIFFFNLLMGMARMAKLIQEATFDEDNLMALIASGGNPMLPSSKRKELINE